MKIHFTEENALSNTIFIFLFWDEQSDIWIYSKA